MGQLTLDGGEVRSATRASLGQPLSATQRAVLAELARHGSVRSVEAGVIVHRMREKGCAVGERTQSFEGGGVGCCPYAATDGNELMKRLMERGLVKRAGRGRWVATA